MHTCHPTLHPLLPLLVEAGVPSSSSDPFGPVDTLDVALATVVCIQGRKDVYRDMAGGRRGGTRLQVALGTESRLGWEGKTYHLGKGYCILDKCLFSSGLSWVLVLALWFRVSLLAPYIRMPRSGCICFTLHPAFCRTRRFIRTHRPSPSLRIPAPAHRHSREAEG